jgi:phosphatidylinositol glycan class T
MYGDSLLQTCIRVPYDPVSPLLAFHTSLLPRSLSAIVRTFDVEEAHLSLTNGRWDYTRWGETVGHGSPSGGEIHAWLSQYEGDETE